MVSIYTTGEKYDLNFKNDLSDGQGILTGPDGFRYEGNWSLGKMNGFGKWTDFQNEI